MNAAFKLFLINEAKKWALTHLGQNAIAIIDQGIPAEIFGDNVLAWYIELLDSKNRFLTGVEVQIDRDGFVGVARIESAEPRLRKLWPGKEEV